MSWEAWEQRDRPAYGLRRHLHRRSEPGQIDWAFAGQSLVGVEAVQTDSTEESAVGRRTGEV